MGRRSDHERPELRKIILDQAEKIIISESLRNLSARKLATSIGYTVGTLYNQFKNLDEIVLHINLRTLESLQTELLKHPQKSIYNFAKTYYQFSQENSNRWHTLFEFRTKEDMGVPDWFQTKLNTLFRMLQEALRQISPDQEASLAEAEVLWAGVHGICILAEKDKLGLVQSTSPLELIKIFIDTYMIGFKHRHPSIKVWSVE